MSYQGHPVHCINCGELQDWSEGAIQATSEPDKHRRATFECPTCGCVVVAETWRIA